MKIRDLINTIKNINFVQIHYSYDGGYYGGYSTYVLGNSIPESIYKLEVDWFEVIEFKNRPCISIHLIEGVRLCEGGN